MLEALLIFYRVVQIMLIPPQTRKSQRLRVGY